MHPRHELKYLTAKLHANLLHGKIQWFIIIINSFFIFRISPEIITALNVKLDNLSVAFHSSRENENIIKHFCLILHDGIKYITRKGSKNHQVLKL